MGKCHNIEKDDLEVIIIVFDLFNSLLLFLFRRFPAFYSCIMDQLCGQLLVLCSRRDKFPPLILQLALTLFSSIYNSFAVFAKVIVECFMKQIYIKALSQSLDTFTQVGLVTIHFFIFSLKQMATGHAEEKSSSGNSLNLFRIDELEVVLESLCDLLSDPSFVPSLFASFDCDPVKSDIVHPLFRYICLCSQ